MVSLLACQRTGSIERVDRTHADIAPSPVPIDPPPLPEDPAAGKRSEAQWREHMRDEEDERQLGFDRSRRKEHRAVVKLIAAARAACDRARGARAIEKVRAEMPGRLTEIQHRVSAIDRWGVNSRLLADYAALMNALADRYPSAKLAALKGDRTEWENAQREFSEREHSIERWLERVDETEEPSE